MKNTNLSSSPRRMFSIHMPLLSLQETINDSPCKIVYLCRDVKDALMSRWYFSISVGVRCDISSARRDGLSKIILGGVPLSGVTRVGLCSGRLKELPRSGDSSAKGWRMLFEDGGDPTGITCQSSGLG
ncbi:hypothetical protein DY000_02002931 [Brassica cretica]|uniref:Sulfotransferase n=1 Tax=Brassica cretica TaxID=69181 RepID=A0ABQ7CHN9_BRACR|nr:hypothetical protein DY000_02002931 [Brassica cretica]